MPPPIARCSVLEARYVQLRYRAVLAVHALPKCGQLQDSMAAEAAGAGGREWLVSPSFIRVAHREAVSAADETQPTIPTTTSPAACSPTCPFVLLFHGLHNILDAAYEVQTGALGFVRLVSCVTSSCQVPKLWETHIYYSPFEDQKAQSCPAQATFTPSIRPGSEAVGVSNGLCKGLGSRRQPLYQPLTTMIVLPRLPAAPPRKRGPDFYNRHDSPAAYNGSLVKQTLLQHQPQTQQHLPICRPLPTVPSRIERLPSELQRMVFSHLDYQALIHLSTLNRYFHRTIQPRKMADPVDMAQFVMRAAKDFPQHRPSEKGHDHRPGNFECYICFRVRSPDHFDMLQPQAAFVDTTGRIVRGRDPDPRIDRQVMLRRFCIDCGVCEGIHAPFDCLTTRTGRDLWVCNCRQVWSKPGCLRCPDCRGDCPLRPRRKLLM